MASDLALAATISPFQADSDPATTAQRWKRWIDRFENLTIAINLTDATRMKALLLHLAGESVQDTYDGLVVDEIGEEDNVAFIHKHVKHWMASLHPVKTSRLKSITFG